MTSKGAKELFRILLHSEEFSIFQGIKESRRNWIIETEYRNVKIRILINKNTGEKRIKFIGRESNWYKTREAYKIKRDIVLRFGRAEPTNLGT